MIIVLRLFLIWNILLMLNIDSFIINNRICSGRCRKSYLKLSLDDTANSLDLLKDFPLSTAIASSVGVFGLWKLFNYWKMQFITAKTVSGIPKQSKVVELDVQDGKNVFYLSQGCDYTAVMKVTESDPVKRKEKNSFNERMILESVGKANSNKLNLQGKVRARTQEIPTRSVDCVLSVGALARSSAVDETLQEVYRMLRPGGLFVFVEPDKIAFSSGGTGGSGDVIELVKRVFPEDIKVKSVSSANIKKSGIDSSIISHDNDDRTSTQGNSSSSSGSSSAGDTSSNKKDSKKVKKSSTYKSRQAALVSEFESSVGVTSTIETPSDDTEATTDTSDSSVNTSAQGAFIISTPSESDITTPLESDDSTSATSASNGAVLKPSSTWTKNSKPGLVFEVHNNILDTYVSGIAVRTY